MNMDTIAAIATPFGNGGVGIVRISGKKALSIAQEIIHQALQPRYATFTPFFDDDNEIIDKGIVLYFKSPHSFTGEDVIELQGHGGQVIMDCLLKRVLSCGARMARPGEFTERAFLNDKLDLIQAEAVADIINATTLQAAQSASRSLQGDFSKEINTFLEELVHLRMFIESAIDFTDEDIDFISEHNIIPAIEALLVKIQIIRKTAAQGVLLQTGIQVVIAGFPNAGKSSLLNCLSGQESAIVTDIAGTTRDVLREHINLDGLVLNIIDTAGIRDTTDVIEQEGVRRAQAEIKKADLILWIYDAREKAQIPFEFPRGIPLIKIKNKIDLISDNYFNQQDDEIAISVTKNQHIDQLKKAIKEVAGFNTEEVSTFMARRRHLTALDKTADCIRRGLEAYQQSQSHELLAEDLYQASRALGEITGTFTTDDLLGKIFAEFCIGK